MPALSCVLLAELCLPNATLWQSSNVNFALAYWSTSVATNLLLTLLIAGRLVWMRYQLGRLMGRITAAHSPYLSIAAMLIESAALYSAVAVPFMTTYARNDTSNFLFFSLLGQVQVCKLLIWRDKCHVLINV